MLDQKRYIPYEEAKPLIEHIGSAPGAVLKWPLNSGGKTHVTAFGIQKHKSYGFRLVASYLSKKHEKPIFQLLDPVEIFRMMECGEIEYCGNIFDLDFRRNFDYERLSLSVIGFLSLAYSTRSEGKVTIDEIFSKMESGELTMDQLIEKAKMMAPSQDVEWAEGV